MAASLFLLLFLKVIMMKQFKKYRTEKELKCSKKKKIPQKKKKGIFSELPYL